MVAWSIGSTFRHAKGCGFLEKRQDSIKWILSRVDNDMK